jgi:hypothetical protein
MNFGIVANSASSSVPVSNGGPVETGGQQDRRQRFAPGDIDPGAVDTMLAQQLGDLSFHDRSQISEEVHGVRSLAPVETPQMIHHALWLLDQEIEKIHPKPAYDQAKHVLQSSLVDDPDFRLRCLRSALFDVKEAAKVLVGFLDLCLDYYGPETLTRPLRMSDLGRDGTELMRNGEFQLLPFRDRSGRRVVAAVGELGWKFSLHTRVSPHLH